jgi:hypothetical protein
MFAASITSTNGLTTPITYSRERGVVSDKEEWRATGEERYAPRWDARVRRGQPTAAATHLQVLLHERVHHEQNEVDHASTRKELPYNPRGLGVGGAQRESERLKGGSDRDPQKGDGATGQTPVGPGGCRARSVLRSKRC